MWKQLHKLTSRFGYRPSKRVVRTDDVRVGLQTPYPRDSFQFAWEDVEEIVAFKRDLGTIDEIRLGFLTKERGYEIGEEDEGFDALVDKLLERHPSISPDWFREVMHPAFATNRTTLWRRDPEMHWLTHEP